MIALISSVAHFVPPTALRNRELAARLGVTEEWIVARTGIRERRIAAAGGTSDLIVPAAEECLRRGGVSAADVDCVLVATITPDRLTPATAVTVRQMIPLISAPPIRACDRSARSAPGAELIRGLLPLGVRKVATS